MLRYTTENVGNYWDSEDYRIFTLHMNLENQLSLLNSNETNMRLYNWTKDCLHKNLYEIMEPEIADRWHQLYPQWKKQGLTSYIVYFDGNTLGWETTVEIVNDLLFVIGKRIYNSIFYGSNIYNNYHIQKEEFLVVTLSLRNKQFFVETIETNANLNLSLILGKNINCVNQFSSNVLHNTVYKECMQRNQVISFVEMYNYAGVHLYLDVTLYPYIKSSKIVACGKIISKDAYYRALKINNMESKAACVNNILYPLTPREREILTFVIDGSTNRYISSVLQISEGTVKKTVFNAYKKIGINSRVDLIRLCYNY